jgi:hypothetical protein
LPADATNAKLLADAPDRGHMLFHGRRRARVVLDVSRHRDGLDVFQALKAGALAPGQELANRMIVRNAGVLVADWDGKEFEKLLCGRRADFDHDGRKTAFNVNSGRVYTKKERELKKQEKHRKRMERRRLKKVRAVPASTLRVCRLQLATLNIP